MSFRTATGSWRHMTFVSLITMAQFVFTLRIYEKQLWVNILYLISLTWQSYSSLRSHLKKKIHAGDTCCKYRISNEFCDNYYQLSKENQIKTYFCQAFMMRQGISRKLFQPIFEHTGVDSMQRIAWKWLKVYYIHSTCHPYRRYMVGHA